MVGLSLSGSLVLALVVVFISHSVLTTKSGSEKTKGLLKTPFTHAQTQTQSQSSLGQGGVWPGTVYLNTNTRPSRSQKDKEEEMRERRTRQLSSLSTTNLQGAGSSDYGYALSGSGSEYGGYAAAGSHGGGYGHGGGHGGGGYGHGKKDCNSALGLLGVLGLVSFLQNVLRQMTTTVAPGRKRRGAGGGSGGVDSNSYSSSNEIEIETEDGGGVDVDRITRLMMPLLMRVAQVKDGLIPPNCLLPETCRANGILVKGLGAEGRSLGAMLTSSIVRMMKDVGDGSVGKDVEKAGRSGRSGVDCTHVYKDCPNLPPTDSSLYTYFLSHRN